MSDAALNADVRVRRGDTFVLDVELELPAGQTTALLGPNGSGKSTLVSAIAGHLAISEGMIELDGTIVDNPASGILIPAQDRNAGVVHQRYLLFEHLSVIDNIAFSQSVRGVSKDEGLRIAQHWIEALDLSGLGERRPSELSGGQQQRVALARALASEPAMLLLDEPLAALDVQTKGSLRRLLKETLDGFAGPRLLITHDPVDAMFLADRVLIIENGKITQSGTPADLAQRPATPYAAALAGLNLLTGSNDAGSLTLDNSTQLLSTSDTQTVGPVLITVNPNAIALHASQPGGSPRNSWETSVRTVEGSGDVTRVTLNEPLLLNVDVTPGAVEAMNLTPGAPVWASIKATEVSVYPS